MKLKKDASQAKVLLPSTHWSKNSEQKHDKLWLLLTILRNFCVKPNV